jgi:hypothetical protein
MRQQSFFVFIVEEVIKGEKTAYEDQQELE